MDGNEWPTSQLVLVRKLRLIVLKGNEILNDTIYPLLCEKVILNFFLFKSICKKYVFVIWWL